MIEFEHLQAEAAHLTGQEEHLSKTIIALLQKNGSKLLPDIPLPFMDISKQRLGKTEHRLPKQSKLKSRRSPYILELVNMDFSQGNWEN